MRRDLIWDFFQNEAPETFAGSRARLAYLANKVKHAGTVLNIGVGGGAFEEVAIRQGLTVYSLDPSERSVAHMRERFGLMDRAQVGYSQDIPFPDQIDPRYSPIGWVWSSLRRRCYQRAAKVVTQTEAVRAWAEAFVRKEAVCVIPSPVAPALAAHSRRGTGAGAS